MGRLDLLSEGLVLLTDDGELAHRLTHPRFEHPKTYYVLVAERPTLDIINRLRKGVELAEGVTAPAEVRIAAHLPPDIELEAGPMAGTWLQITLREGKKRQIRHMTAAVGFPTLRLVRWAIGPLNLGALKPGQSERLTQVEIAALRSAVRDGQRTRPSNSKRRPGAARGASPKRGRTGKPHRFDGKPRQG